MLLNTWRETAPGSITYETVLISCHQVQIGPTKSLDILTYQNSDDCGGKSLWITFRSKTGLYCLDLFLFGADEANRTLARAQTYSTSL
jgi:hypothetical protein